MQVVTVVFIYSFQPAVSCIRLQMLEDVQCM